MRIIGGEARGRRLFAPSGDDTRPTSDRTRESVFNILRNDVPDAVVLDLFGGTGALALEALSRGARKAAICDISPAAISVINRNAECVLPNDARSRVKVVRGDYKRAISALAGWRFTLTFLDPPYRMNEYYSDALTRLVQADLLEKDSIIVIEREKGCAISLPEEIEIYDSRDYRDTVVDFAYRR